MDTLFQSAGLGVLENVYSPIPDAIAHPWSHMHLLSVGELVKNVEASGEDVRHWQDLYAGAIEETRNSASIRMAMVVAVGQKDGSERSSILPQFGFCSTIIVIGVAAYVLCTRTQVLKSHHGWPSSWLRRGAAHLL